MKITVTSVQERKSEGIESGSVAASSFTEVKNLLINGISK